MGRRRRRGGVRLRCFFHLVNTHTCIRDEVGLEVADLEAAKIEALRAVHDLRKEEPDADETWCGWQLDITDNDGRLVLSIPLDMTRQ